MGNSMTPDRAIIDAYDATKAIRAESYADLDKPEAEQWSEREAHANDERLRQHETIIERSEASTIKGVSCRLQLLIRYLDQSLWVDRTLVEQGWEALYESRDDLGHEARQAIEAVNDLERMDPLRPFAQVWVERWLAIGGTFAIGAGTFYFGRVEPDVWKAPEQHNPALSPHEWIVDAKEQAGAAKMLESLLTLIPGATEAVKAAAVDRGLIMTAEG